MTINFIQGEPPSTGGVINTCYLKADNWDDYSLKTSFLAVYYDNQANAHLLGSLKIAKFDLNHGWVKDLLPPNYFHRLDDTFISVGQDDSYYTELRKLDKGIGDNILISLNDISFNSQLIKKFSNQKILRDSLLRFVSVPTIFGQYKRILDYGSSVTEFVFSYKREQTAKFSALDLNFSVQPNSKPASNINVLIGRNGVGKTTVFNGIVKSIIMPLNSTVEDGALYDIAARRIKDDFFSSIVSVSFSAFDPFIPPPNRHDKGLGTCYYYVGLKKGGGGLETDRTILKSTLELQREIVSSIRNCFSLESKKTRWIKAIASLESDNNFQEMNLKQLAFIHNDIEYKNIANNLIERMSSGHQIVLMIVSKLVEYVEEKALILIDEPECHLHPPLLSALIRAISELLLEKNAVSLIATHSPVVLQEIPRSCSWILNRTRLEGRSDRPLVETFGENVGILTREVFGLEVSKSGFYDLLLKEVESGQSFEQIVGKYNEQIGFEGRSILRVLIAEHSKKVSVP